MLALVALVATGCGTPSSGSGALPGEAEFVPVAAGKLRETVGPDSYVIVACRFMAGNGLGGQLPADAPLSEAPPGAREDLGSILAAVDQRLVASSGEDSGAEEGVPPPPRAWDLAVASRWIADLRVAEPPGPGGVVTVACRIGGKEILFALPAPRLLEHLRAVSLRALETAMARPRIAEPWQHAALGAFCLPLGPGSPLERSPRQRELLRGRLLAYLASPDLEGAVAEALLPFVSGFGAQELSAHLRSETLPLRVLALSRSALAGERPALVEILALAGEYFGREQLFCGALATLFPRALDEELHRKYVDAPASPVACLAFIQEVGGRLRTARFVEGSGWVLDEGRR